MTVTLATPAWAHAFLVRSVPPVGGSVATAPQTVQLRFTEGVEPAFSAIAVQDAAGASMTTGRPYRNGTSTVLKVKLKKLPPGTYRVTWQAVAVDTHRTTGNFTFTVAH